MPTPAEMIDDVATQALEPVSSSTADQSATSRSVPDMLQAVQAIEMRTAVRKRRRGIAFTKLIPAGALPDSGRALPGFERAGGY